MFMTRLLFLVVVVIHGASDLNTRTVPGIWQILFISEPGKKGQQDFYDPDPPSKRSWFAGLCLGALEGEGVAKKWGGQRPPQKV
jgi:hypothetical protein